MKKILLITIIGTIFLFSDTSNTGTTTQDIIKLEKKIIDNIAKKQQTNSITETHYNLAISSLSDALEKFVKFAEYQCNYSVGASGAVAFGGSQINLSCLIQLNDWRIQYLETVLAED